MRSPKGSAAGTRRGFTIIEIILVVALMAILARFAVVATTRFYQNRELDVTADTLATYLRSAEVRALRSEGDTNQGVSTVGSKLTLFRGTSYATRLSAYDTLRTYPSYVTITGLTEVVFAKQTGAPSATGLYTLTNGIRTTTVRVYSTGAIERQ